MWDDLRADVADVLDDPEAVLLLNDSGDLEKGCHTVGVRTGTAGRIENAQMEVFWRTAAPRQDFWQGRKVGLLEGDLEWLVLRCSR